MTSESDKETVVEKEVVPQQQGVPDVFLKLFLFTLAMITLPLLSYYVSLHYVFPGYNPTYAGGTAALVANVVLFAYVFEAFREDQQSSRPKTE
ncbi:vacuolar ATPase assembly integral membrane protein vma21 [Saitoella coloradoensis]